jgi:hypothetical protein
VSVAGLCSRPFAGHGTMAGGTLVESAPAGHRLSFPSTAAAALAGGTVANAVAIAEARAAEVDRITVRWPPRSIWLAFRSPAEDSSEAPKA